MITVVDFAEIRGEKPDTVSAYIRRNASEFEGHLGKEKNRMTLDEVAVEILDKVYPLPKPVEVIEDKESRQALILIQQKYIQLQMEMQALKDEMAEDKIALADSKAQLLLLEKKAEDGEVAKAKVEELQAEKVADASKIATLEAEKNHLEESKASLEEENAAQKEELERLKSRGLFARIFNK